MNSEKVIKRSLQIKLPPHRSAFLWGPRQCGKTTLLKQIFPQSLFYNLLENDTFARFFKSPHRLREEILQNKKISQPIIIDEVQKIPSLLDEVHNLIEKEKLQFILCGSSARKLKRGHANLLGGRAWKLELFPLTFKELGEKFNLLQALKRGLIPSHYFDKYYEKSHQAYIQNYLKEEIQQEGLVRNLPAFARFLDAVSFSDGEMVNYQNIARECGIDSKTVAQYYQILVDTLIGSFVEPFRKVRKRQILTATAKFYFFDVGLSSSLTQRIFTQLKGEMFGKAFEQFIYMELRAYHAYLEKRSPINYWRTKTGHEVDFVLAQGKVAVEVKGASEVHLADLKGLVAFMEEHQPMRQIVVCQEKNARVMDNGIEVLPWKLFLEELWSGKII